MDQMRDSILEKRFAAFRAHVREIYPEKKPQPQRKQSGKKNKRRNKKPRGGR